MHAQTLLATLTLAFAATVLAENDVTASDVPRACLPACQFSIDLSARCDRSTGSDDEYLPCVCETADAQTRLTQCASCVKDNGMSDPDDNDVADLMDDCGWDFNDASGPYPTDTGSVTTAASSSSSSPSATTTPDTVTVTQTPSSSSSAPVTETPSSGPSTSASTSASSVASPESTPSSQHDSQAGIVSPKAIAAPLVGLVAGFLFL